MTLNHIDHIYEEIQYRKKKAVYINELLGLLYEMLAAAIVCALIFIFLFGGYVQEGSGMHPSLKEGDIIIYFRPTLLSETEAVVYEAEGKLHTGRIVATPGAELSQTGDHQLTINGIYMPPDEENGVSVKTFVPEDFTEETIQGYYILNDSRTKMTDSREYGAIDKEHINGRIVIILRRRNI